MTDTATIRRLRKLLILANDSRAPEAEAALAMEMAQKLMLEHNLTMAAVEIGGGEKIEGRERTTTDLNLMYKWKQELLRVCVETNFCWFSLVWREQAKGERIAKGYEIIGRQSNVIAAQNLYAYLCQAIERILVVEVGTSPQVRYNKWSHSFRLGCSARLQERLQTKYDALVEEQRRKEREEKACRAHPSSAGSNLPMVLVDEYVRSEADLNNDVRRGWEPGTTARRRREDELERQRENAARKETKLRLIAEGIAADVADYMTYGYSRETAERFCKPETPSQARKREKRDERYWERAEERERRKRAKIDRSGFGAGYQQGENVSLSDQVDRTERKKLG